MIFGIREPIITTTISLLPLFGDISSSNIHLQSYLDKTRTTLFLFKKWVLWSRLNRPTAIVFFFSAQHSSQKLKAAQIRVNKSFDRSKQVHHLHKNNGLNIFFIASAACGLPERCLGGL